MTTSKGFKFPSGYTAYFKGELDEESLTTLIGCLLVKVENPAGEPIEIADLSEEDFWGILEVVRNINLQVVR